MIYYILLSLAIGVIIYFFGWKYVKKHPEKKAKIINTGKVIIIIFLFLAMILVYFSVSQFSNNMESKLKNVSINISILDNRTKEHAKILTGVISRMDSLGENQIILVNKIDDQDQEIIKIKNNQENIKNKIKKQDKNFVNLLAKVKKGWQRTTKTMLTGFNKLLNLGYTEKDIDSIATRTGYVCTNTLDKQTKILSKKIAQSQCDTCATEIEITTATMPEPEKVEVSIQPPETVEIKGVYK